MDWSNDDIASTLQQRHIIKNKEEEETLHKNFNLKQEDVKL
jgi:hypothetical protein